MHYRKIRHLSTLVAFTDLIAMNDSTNKTAESTRIQTAKFPECFFRRIAQKCATNGFLNVRLNIARPELDTIGWENYLESDALYSVALLPGLIMPRCTVKTLGYIVTIRSLQ